MDLQKELEKAAGLRKQREQQRARDREAIRVAMLDVMRNLSASPATRTRAAALLLELTEVDN